MKNKNKNLIQIHKTTNKIKIILGINIKRNNTE
jgi:hypothetical protein